MVTLDLQTAIDQQFRRKFRYPRHELYTAAPPVVDVVRGVVGREPVPSDLRDEAVVAALRAQLPEKVAWVMCPTLLLVLHDALAEAGIDPATAPESYRLEMALAYTVRHDHTPIPADNPAILRQFAGSAPTASVRSVRLFLRFAATRGWRDGDPVTPAMAKEWYADVERRLRDGTYQPSTAQLMTDHVRRFLRHALQGDERRAALQACPRYAAQIGDVEQRRWRPLTPAEIDAVLAASRATYADKRSAAMVPARAALAVALCGGVSIEHVVALQGEALLGNTLTFSAPRRGDPPNPRTLTGIAAELVLSYFAARPPRPGMPLFMVGDHRLSRAPVDTWFTRWCREADVTGSVRMQPATVPPEFPGAPDPALHIRWAPATRE